MESSGGARKSMVLAVAVAVSLAGCTSPTPAASATSRLRVINNGPASAKSLTVWFPRDQIAFGDVPAGARTDYKNAPNGVFPYAAYKLEIDGEIVTQPVIDWVGAEPMSGRAFTYVIEVDTRQPRFQIVRLVSVTPEQ